ncbi:MAG: hypothetical protein RIR51_613 [Bacteroidota bacterium]|jgi:Fic family protein
MKPPYKITSEIVKLVAEISERLGQINAIHLYKPPPELRKKNRIKTIQSTLELEGNTLTEEQVFGLLENKRVIGPPKDILEVQNAIELYNQIHLFNPNSLKDFKKAHAILMKGLIEQAGKFRTKNVGIMKGASLKHLGPNGRILNGLMKDLFSYLKSAKEISLIKSCVFHYELEFIHPFLDGNGRMGRFWQTVILIQEFPVFEYLPIESLIKENQEDYYKVLEQSDKLGESTPFIEWMLTILLESLNRLLESQNRSLTVEDRIALFKEKFQKREFSRKDYLLNFKEISIATASRDLRWAVNQNILIKKGDKRITKYEF